MKVLRLYADATGVARVEWRRVPLDPDGSGRPTSPQLPVGNTFFLRETPTELAGGRHVAPRRQFIFVVSGGGEIELDDGSRHSFSPGDLLFAENTTGEGHVTHNRGNVRGFAYLSVADDFDITRWPLAD